MAIALFNVRFILLISASFIAIFSSIAIYFCLPILISHMIRSQIALSPNSGSFNGWRLNSVIDQIYLYNITNLSDSTSEPTSRKQSRQALELQQVGPFTFRQHREKLNIKFDPTNETVIYDQKKTWTFLPELSRAKSVDEMNSLWIHHMSISLAGTVLSPEYGEIIDPIVAENDLRMFLNHSVKALLFDGYYDLLMEQAKASGQIDVDRFGWMHNQNNSISKSIRIFTGPSNATMDKFGSIDQYDHDTRFNIWHRNGSEAKDFSDVQCNEFRFSSTGEFFPPSEDSLISHNYHYHGRRRDSGEHSDSKHEVAKQVDSVAPLASPAEVHATARDSGSSKSEIVSASSGGVKLDRHSMKIGKTISLFMPDLCRTFRLNYDGSYYFRDLLVDRYIANRNTYVYPTNNNDDSVSILEKKFIESNRCYCNYNETSKLTSCPPNGLMDLYSCRKGSPVSISFPHFLYSNQDKSLAPILKLFKDDVQANEEEHQLFIDLEPTLNVPVNAQIVIQFNVRFKNDQTMNFTKEYAYLFDDPSPIDNSSSPQADIYLPQMWIKSRAEMSADNLRDLKFIQKQLNLVTPITTMLIFGFASILLMASAKLAYDLTYGPNSTHKTLSCDHESYSSSDGDHHCNYPDEKKKYLNISIDMQLMACEDSHLKVLSSSSPSKLNPDDHAEYNAHALPSTSKKSNNLVTSSKSIESNLSDFENQPLNR